MSASAIKDATTPFPYVVGHVMGMTNSEGEDMSVTITGVFPLTVSPVMEVQIRTKKGFQKAILKLYDRRFGEMREVHAHNPKNRHNPHNQWVEEAWQGYVRRGLAKTLSERLQRMDEEDCLGYLGDSDSDEEMSQWEKVAKAEGIIHHVTQKHYINEIQAYEQLRTVQGRLVPRLIAPVTLYLSSTQSYLPSDLSPSYFQVRGILLQRINGFSLENLLLNVPNPPTVQEQIIQNAVDTAREVNRAGVINFDSAPRNVMVARLDGYTFQTFIIDFADCGCKWQYKDTDDINDIKSWGRMVHIYNDPRTIGCIIVSKVEKVTGFVPKINY